MNYRDTDGHWQKIDDTLVSDGDGWVNRADAFHVHLPQAAGGAIVLATRAGTRRCRCGVPPAAEPRSERRSTTARRFRR